MSTPRVQLPWWHPEEDGGDDDFPVETFPSLQAAGVDLVAAFKNWLHNNHPKPYKFVGLLLNSETSSFEKEVKDYCLSHRHILSLESGDDFLILHHYMDKALQRGASQLLKRTYTYLTMLDVSRTSLPAIYIIPYAAMTSITQDYDGQSLLIELSQGRESWEGTVDDYLTTILRCLYDSVDTIPNHEPNPLISLEAEFNSQIRGQIGESWTKNATKVANMPIISTLLKIIISS
ncbi:hypothetical protein KAR91_85240 [Candidatus Pacearchaeota archaeon]|nr:hypothetical protein [Candidatus Pacearchaeota archaeon]